MTDEPQPTDEQLRPPTPTRITIVLPPKGVEALKSIITVRQINRTDAVTQALLVWDLLQKTIANGGTVYIRSTDGGDLAKLYVL